MSALQPHEPPVAQVRAVGYAVDWHEPGWPQFRADEPRSYATREVTAAPVGPDLDLSGRSAVWLTMRDASLALLSNAALMVGCQAFEVRYVLEPRPTGPATLRMFLTAKVFDSHQALASAAVRAACGALPAGFVTAVPQDGPHFGGQPSDDKLIVELRREELVTLPEWDYIPAEFYYSLADQQLGDGSGWSAFWRTLSEVTDPVTISLLFQQTDLHPTERGVLGSLLTDLGMYSEQRTDYDFLYNPVTYPACANARLVLQSWEKRLEQLRRPLLARLAVRGPATTAVAVATALASAVGTSAETGRTHALSIDAPLTAVDQRQAAFGFDWLEILPWGGHQIWTHPDAPVSLRRLPYLYGLAEAAGLLVLPVPDAQGVPGMRRARQVAARREGHPSDLPARGIRLGVSMHHGVAGSPIDLPLDALNRHALIVGASGAGKTTTVLTLLARLWREHRIPFLVLESTKAEYRSLLGMQGLEAVQVITLGNEGIAPLRLNPLAPPPGVRGEVHQGTVLASLKLALPLFPPLPQLLPTAIARTYEAAGWQDDTTIADGMAPPGLRDLRRQFWLYFKEIGYEGEARNIGRAFDARLESLLQGSRGKVLDTVHSLDFAALLGGPVVVELKDVHDSEDRAVLSAFLLEQVRAMAVARGSSRGELRHLTVVEEAHRLLSKADLGTGTGEDGNRARSDAVRAFCEAVAELRAFGEGFVLCSQRPNDLADAAVANTGTRILHRLENSTDRDVMLDDLDADPQTRQIAARLRLGEALIHWPERDETEVFEVIPPADVDSGLPVPDDSVAAHMAGYRQRIRQLLPYRLCSPEVCPDGCHPAVRQVGATTTRAVAGPVGQLWQQPDAVASILRLIAAEPPGTLRGVCCAAAQLGAEGIAFRTRPGQDGRAGLIRAAREVLDSEDQRDRR